MGASSATAQYSRLWQCLAVQTVGHGGAGDAVECVLVAGRPQLLLLARRPRRRVLVERQHEGVAGRGEAEEVPFGQPLQRVLGRAG